MLAYDVGSDFFSLLILLFLGNQSPQPYEDQPPLHNQSQCIIRIHNHTNITGLQLSKEIANPSAKNRTSRFLRSFQPSLDEIGSHCSTVVASLFLQIGSSVSIRPHHERHSTSQHITAFEEEAQGI
ncbi:hypothetical protein BZA77DRAFT_48139 [Pyronema omphalodes]|nr:hypothetical protein BZA77DRAFT_48139 [Pyronema omphalodes]